MRILFSFQFEFNSLRPTKAELTQPYVAAFSAAERKAKRKEPEHPVSDSEPDVVLHVPGKRPRLDSHGLKQNDFEAFRSEVLTRLDNLSKDNEFLKNQLSELLAMYHKKESTRMKGSDEDLGLQQFEFRPRGTDETIEVHDESDHDNEEQHHKEDSDGDDGDNDDGDNGDGDGDDDGDDDDDGNDDGDDDDDDGNDDDDDDAADNSAQASNLKEMRSEPSVADKRMGPEKGRNLLLI